MTILKALLLFMVCLNFPYIKCYNLLNLCELNCYSVENLVVSKSNYLCYLCSIFPKLKFKNEQTLAKNDLIDEDDITEIQLTKDEIDLVLDELKIDLDELNSHRQADVAQTDDEVDSFSHFTYQVIRQSIESYVRNMTLDNLNSTIITTNISNLRENIETIKYDFDSKVNFLKAKQENLNTLQNTSSTSLNLLFIKFEHFQEKLNQVGLKINQIEKNLQSVSLMVQNFSNTIGSLETRVKNLELKNFSVLNFSQNIENSTNITKILKVIDKRLDEVEEKLGVFYSQKSNFTQNVTEFASKNLQQKSDYNSSTDNEILKVIEGKAELKNRLFERYSSDQSRSINFRYLIRSLRTKYFKCFISLSQTKSFILAVRESVVSYNATSNSKNLTLSEDTIKEVFNPTEALLKYETIFNKHIIENSTVNFRYIVLKLHKKQPICKVKKNDVNVNHSPRNTTNVINEAHNLTNSNETFVKNEGIF
jgi:hypothetical protein